MYDFTNQWRGGAAFTYYFEDFTFWSLDLDAQYLATEFGDGFELRPLAGINITRVAFSSLFGEFSDSRTSLNLGAMLQKELNGTSVYLEPKITIGDGSALLIGAGILF